MNKVKGNATRKHNGWYPVLDYPNGGKVIGKISFATFEQAKFEAWEMIEHMEQYPNSYANKHPKENQLIDLREKH